jgi:GH25 family lysozyme M1 (1,4-beta-N-acetylmuramidase)
MIEYNIMDRGIDTSRWQSARTMINWEKVAGAEIKFAIIRSSVGNHYQDEFFERDWREARANNLLLSAYHVVVPTQSPESQIGIFLERVGHKRNDLPLVLDVEILSTPGRDEIPANKYQVTANLRRCIELLPEKPIIYTGAWYWNPYVLRSSEWKEYPLWAASYHRSTPYLPYDWSDYLIWQYSSTEFVPGISVYVDVNYYNGKLPSRIPTPPKS